jgi:hypothetical protein
MTAISLPEVRLDRVLQHSVEPLYGQYGILAPLDRQPVCPYFTGMNSTETERFEMRAPKVWLAAIDEWRRAQSSIPSRAAAIRHLVELGLSAKNPSAPSGGNNPGGASKPSGAEKRPAPSERKPGRQAEPAPPQSKEAQIRALREQGAGQ